MCSGGPPGDCPPPSVLESVKSANLIDEDDGCCTLCHAPTSIDEGCEDQTGLCHHCAQAEAVRLRAELEAGWRAKAGPLPKYQGQTGWMDEQLESAAFRRVFI